MSLTLVATFNTKDEANGAVDALVEAGWERKVMSTTVRREIGVTRTNGLNSTDADSFRAVVLVAVIGAAIGAAIGMLFNGGQNLVISMTAGAIVGLAIGAYSGAVASARVDRSKNLEELSPQLSAKERVMVSLTVADERQEVVSKILRRHGAFAVREWSLITNESPQALHV